MRDAGISTLEDRVALTNSLALQALITMANLPTWTIAITSRKLVELESLHIDFVLADQSPKGPTLFLRCLGRSCYVSLVGNQ